MVSRYVDRSHTEQPKFQKKKKKSFANKSFKPTGFFGASGIPADFQLKNARKKQ